MERDPPDPLPSVYPDLGHAEDWEHAVEVSGYLVTFSPLAPHTLPGEAHLVVDRRYLPGETPDQVASGVAAALDDVDDYEVEVRAGVTMRPALVAPDEPVVADLTAAIAEVGREPATGYLGGTFDAGVWCDAGIPTVMWGVGGPDDILGDDWVTVADAVHEAEVLASLWDHHLGSAGSPMSGVRP